MWCELITKKEKESTKRNAMIALSQKKCADADDDDDTRGV